MEALKIITSHTELKDESSCDTPPVTEDKVTECWSLGCLEINTHCAWSASIMPHHCCVCVFWKLILSDSAQSHRRCKTSSTQTGSTQRQCRWQQRCKATHCMSWRWAWGSSLVQSAQFVGMFGSRACGWTLLACTNKDADQCHTQQKCKGKHQDPFLVPNVTDKFIFCFCNVNKLHEALWEYILSRQKLLSQEINLDCCINKGCFWELSPMPGLTTEVSTRVVVISNRLS
jgi:hypothetical protein